MRTRVAAAPIEPGSSMRRAPALVACLLMGFITPVGADECQDASVRMKTTIERLDGHKEPPRSPDVYRDGFKIEIFVSVSDPRASEVTVTGLQAEHQFAPGRQAELAERQDLAANSQKRAPPPTARCPSPPSA